MAVRTKALKEGYTLGGLAGFSASGSRSCASKRWIHMARSGASGRSCCAVSLAASAKRS